MSLLLSLAMSLALAQNPSATPPSSASVSGVVVTGGADEPVSDVTVELFLVPRKDAGLAGPPGRDERGELLLALPPGLSILPASTTRAARLVATTGEDGRFTIGNVPPGEYHLYATHPNGFLPAEYQQRTATGTGATVTLAEDQKLSDVVLRMTPTASISGRIIDADGDPVVFASILAFRIAHRANGERKVEIAQSVLTDDRGEFRMFWLAPGRYYLSAMPIETRQYGLPLMYAARFGGAQYLATPMLGYRTNEAGEIVEETWVPIYYPGTTDIVAAKQIELSPAEEFNVVMNVAASPTRTLQARGVVLDPAGKPLANADVTVTLKRTDGHSVVLPRGTTDPNGAFTLHGIVPGSYLIFVTGQMTSGPFECRMSSQCISQATAALPLDIGDTDVSGIRIQTVPSINIPWRARFESRAEAESVVPGIEVRLVRQPAIPFGSMQAQRIVFDEPVAGPNKPDAVQMVSMVGAGDYRIEVANLPKGAYIKSMRMGGTDVLRDGLHVAGGAPELIDIVVVASGGILSGQARDSLDRPLDKATVVLVPELGQRQTRLDLFKVAISDPSGKFRMEGIAPGDYRVFAWESVREGDWFDAEFMEQLELQGVAVRIADTDPAQITLQAIPAERSGK